MFTQLLMLFQKYLLVESLHIAQTLQCCIFQDCGAKAANQSTNLKVTIHDLNIKRICRTCCHFQID